MTTSTEPLQLQPAGRRRHRRISWAAGLFTASLVLALAVPMAYAVTPVGNHEIDADLEAGTDAGGTVDWAPNNGIEPGGTTAGAGVAIFDGGADETCPEGNTGANGDQIRPSAVTDGDFQATLICDSVSFPGESDANIFTGGAKESDPDSQTTKSGPVTPKTDLTNAYARGVIAPDSGNDPGDPDDLDDAWVVAAYEVIPKQGSYHTNVEFNQFVKCVATGEIVDDVSDCGDGAQVVPFRTAGDVLLAVDIGGSNDPEKAIRLLGFVATGGDSTTNAVYDFGKNEAQTIENADFAAFGTTDGIDTPVVRATINGGTIDCGPWGCYDEGYDFVNQLPAESFVEVAANLSAFTDNVCLNNVAFKSRASGQSVTSQLKDTTSPQPFPFCGGLSVEKYIDADESGDISDGDVTTSAQAAAIDSAYENDLEGWAFTVEDANGNVVCEGTTTSEGDLVCATGDLTQLAPGTYTVTETNPELGLADGATSFNTDPGGTAPLSKDVTVSLGGDATVAFGNTCRITKVFEVTDVPDGVTDLFAYYTVTNDELDDNATQGTVVLSDGANGTVDDGIWQGTAPETFTDGDALTWQYGVSTDDKAFVGSHTFDASQEGYRFGCTTTNTEEFDPPTLTVTKVKDVTADGRSNDDPGLSDWSFNLYRDGGDGVFGDGDGSITSDDTFIEQVTTADGTGDTTLGEAVNTVDLAPGTYWVEEVPQDNWDNTYPGPNDNGDVVHSIALTIGQDGSRTFANTPLSRVTVEFEDLTGSTDATITCSAAIGDAESADGAEGETVSVSASDLRVGEYECTVVIVDP